MIRKYYNLCYFIAEFWKKQGKVADTAALDVFAKRNI